jgi:hypothetical protein
MTTGTKWLLAASSRILLGLENTRKEGFPCRTTAIKFGSGISK